VPYKSLKDANNAILGIDPPVTLAQANMISEWADAMAASTSKNKPENPWAASISQFYKLYRKNEAGTAWVQKQQETRKERRTQEAFKTVDGKKRPASDFLVVGSKNDPDTWSLPAKVNGKIDLQLLREAWVTLRGNKYDGPDEQKAIDKLKALYKRADMPLPTEETDMAIVFNDDPQFDDAVIIEKDGKFYHAPFREDQLAPTGEWREVVRQWVFVEADATPGGPEMCVCPECGAEAEHEAGLPCRATKCPSCGADMIAKVEATEMSFAESASGAAISLHEATEAEPLVMDVCLIQPGWGNASDNNYYSREMLKRDAHQFVGAHQFEKDHTNDKTTRDWVSTIDSIVGETAEGGPIARVVVHDPNFAERVKLLDKAGLLKELPCSILASGMATEFELDGKKGNQVEAITKVSAVDWVTAAGAGGHALSLSEQEADMSEKKRDVDETIEVSEDATEVSLTEDETGTEEIPTADAAVAPEEPDQDEQEDDEVEHLTGTEVSVALEAAQLPPAARAKLERGQYTEAELQEAITAEKTYISDLTEAGKPFGHSPAARKAKVDLVEIEQKQDAVNARWIGSRVREEAHGRE